MMHSMKRSAVRDRLFTLVAVLACAAALSAATQQTRRVDPSMSLEEAITAYRTDLQANRASVIGKNVALTPDQAAKFWPMFERYMKEQSAIMDEQMRGIQTYIANLDSMDDGAALALMQAHLDRDANMAALRRHWLTEFLTVLPAKQAVRVMQIDRRISLAQQTEFSAQIPLVQ